MQRKQIYGLVMAALLGSSLGSAVQGAEVNSAALGMVYAVSEASQPATKDNKAVGVVGEGVKEEAATSTVAMTTAKGIQPVLVSSVLTTVDNKKLNVPQGVTVFDLKRMITPQGMIDGTAFLSAKQFNEEYVNNIRQLAKVKEVNVPELQQFQGEIFRDWNAYQLRGEDAKGVHTAYVVDVALGKDYIQGERAELKLTKALWQALAKEVDGTTASSTNIRGGSLNLLDSLETAQRATGIVRNVPDATAFATSADSEKMFHTWQFMKDFNTTVLAENEAWLASYPTSYSPEAFRQATIDGYKAVKTSQDATTFNTFVNLYKDKFVKAIVADLVNHEKQLAKDATTNERAKEKLAMSVKVREGLQKFFATSNLEADTLGQIKPVNSKLGPALYMDSRMALTFDSYEIPVGSINVIRFEKEGPVFTFLATNDGDFNYWEKQLKATYGIQ